MRLVLIVATLVVLGCGAPRTDPFLTPGPDASALDALDMDTNPCATVEGQGCPCGALAGVWRCVGSTPVCVCPMPDAARADVPRDMGVAVGRCMSDSDCNDRIDCTLDECIVGGVCTHAPVNNFCPTGQRCTADRGCTTGRVCARDADCNDNVPCTHDVCAAGGACMNVRDDSVCTGGMRCSVTLGCIAPDASTSDVPLLDATVDGGRPMLEQHLDHAEVWISSDGEPSRMVVGTCGRATDTSGSVYVYVPSVTDPTAYAVIQPTMPASSALVVRCGGRSYPLSGTSFEISPFYDAGGRRRFNARATGTRSTAATCTVPTRVDLFAFGCVAF